MTKVLLIEIQELGIDTRADNLRARGLDVTPSVRSVIPGRRFDSVIYVISSQNALRAPEEKYGEVIIEIRDAYPRAKVVVYSSHSVLDEYKKEINAARAIPLEMITTLDDMARQLR